jgi:Ca2+-binding EF-hand superfamily protein
MTELDDKEFDILFGTIDTDHNGELSSEEVMEYFHSLHLGVKQDFGESVGKYLSGKFTKDAAMAAIWSKLDINGDGVVSPEELDLFVASELTEFSRKDASFLHHAIDTNSDGVVSFSEFKSFMDSLEPPALSP